MEINNISSPYNYNCQFLANIQSHKLKFKQEDFFVKIRGYGRNTNWANEVKNTADTATNLIRRNTSLENILKIISMQLRKANQLTTDIDKKNHTGILRIFKNGWLHGSSWDGFNLCTSYNGKDSKRYQCYADRLDGVVKKPLNNSLNISLTTPMIGKEDHYLEHGHPRKIEKAFGIIAKTFEHFRKNYNYKNIQKSDLSGVNNDVAKIRWVLAHATPWERGSDAISNILMRAMYKSLGIKSYPLKKGVSLDMEAYCTNLRDYKKNFASYFEKTPEIIE